jgi:hypothetical protein
MTDKDWERLRKEYLERHAYRKKALSVTEEAYWQKLQEVGWLEYLSPEEQEDMRPRLKRDLANNDKWAFLNLNQGGWDGEDPDYEDILKHLARVSRRVFYPTNIALYCAQRWMVR